MPHQFQRDPVDGFGLFLFIGHDAEGSDDDVMNNIRLLYYLQPIHQSA